MTRILVIDDSPQIRRALRAGLERAGFEVTLAETGDEGLDLAAMNPPDLILLDLALPGVDGFEVCRQIREWNRLPIIVVSVREDEQDKIRALNLGADDYVTKPFGLEELIARIRAVLRRSAESAEPDAPVFSSGGLSIDFSH